MFCCCASHEDDEDEKNHDPVDGNPGPEVNRHCTDICCLLFFLVAIGAHVYLLFYLHDVSSTDILTHGHDHYLNMCGKGELVNKSYVYYPDLQTDFAADPTLRTHYGVCVNQCPEQATTILDYEWNGTVESPATTPAPPRRKAWFVPLPSYPIIGRCIPYEPLARKVSETDFCAFPACEQIPGRDNQDIPTKPQQVCGLSRDQTSKFWLLSEPDVTVVEGWRSEGASEETIKARVEQAKQVEGLELKSKCEVIVKRGLNIKMSPADDHYLVQVLTRYTGAVFSHGVAVYKERYTVIGLGIGGAMVASFIVICLLTIVARCVVFLLLFLLFASLGSADYVLFVLAGVTSGSTGRMIIQTFENATEYDLFPTEVQSLLDEASGEDKMMEVYKWSAIILACLIMVLVCVVIAIWKNFEILIALLQEASRTIRQMPSLLVFPFMGLVSMVVTSFGFLTIFLGIATTDSRSVESLLEAWKTYVEPMLEMADLKGEDSFEQMQEWGMWIILFHFLWAYFFHVAMFVAIIAFSVSRWFFYREDSEHDSGTGIGEDGWFFGKPILVAFKELCRYHLGSFAFGSFILAVVTMPRIVLEYISANSAADQNQVTKAIIWALRCCLWCLEKCVQFLTEYAYVYVAVTGKPFCSAARASFTLFTKYPVQVALDKTACVAMGFLASVTVPVSMAVVAFPLIKTQWFPCAIFIVILAYVTTRLTTGVYDVCVTTLFVCAMRDKEFYGGKYTSPGLRHACGFEPKKDEGDADAGDVEVELVDAES